ncbi:MAG: hypothetical protein ACP5OG_03485 [Candidatus Nanoarchaeia archaeon]
MKTQKQNIMQQKNKKEIAKKQIRSKKIEALSIILNLTLAIIAFSVLISFESKSVSGEDIQTTDFSWGGLTGTDTKIDTPKPTTPTPPAVTTAAPAAVSKIVASKGTEIYTVTSENGILLKGVGESGADITLAKGATMTKNLDTGKIFTTVGDKQIEVSQTALDSAVKGETISKGAVVAPEKGTTYLSQLMQVAKGTWQDALASGLQYAAMGYGIGMLVGGLFGMSDKNTKALSFALAGGMGLWKSLATYNFGSQGAWLGTYAPVIGIAVGAGIFLAMYKKEKTRIVEFNCLSYEPPVGGQDCEKCNEYDKDGVSTCSEYRCRSLGQACQLLNSGTKQESCTWVNPRDVTSPKLSVKQATRGHKIIPDTNVRPGATGVIIQNENSEDKCIQAFTPLEFNVVTDEQAQCKIDYNLTTSFDAMSYYIAGSNLYSYNHTEKMSLPGPDALNKVDPEIKNDGTYTLYVRCRDANGNYNVDAFSVRFCVEPGPDVTSPVIVGTSVETGSPIQYNTTNLSLEVYVNEPSECKWTRDTDKDYNNMENNMSCNSNVWEMNANMVYTCKTTLNGISDRQENKYYFRCKDKPQENESNRYTMQMGYEYIVMGTQPLNILMASPNGTTIQGSTDSVKVLLEIKTDNGYNNGESICAYSQTGIEKDYIDFLENTQTAHLQTLYLTSGSYTYYLKCYDLGGNSAYEIIKFNISTDRAAPIVARAYKEANQLKIIVNENSSCSYSNIDCNFEIGDGIAMSGINETDHAAAWESDKSYYIRCVDKYNNQVEPNKCSIIVKPFNMFRKE